MEPVRLMHEPPVRVAVLDLYDNEPNQGMRCIKELLRDGDGRFSGRALTLDVYEARYKAELPGLDYDVYLSSGGPGSPFDGEGKPWEKRYFDWLESVWNHNRGPGTDKKHVLFICHSFQMMCRFFRVAEVTRRHSPSFGIFPVHKTPAGKREPLYRGLRNPFYAADFRSWQVVRPDARALQDLGAEVLSLEKIRPHVPYERAVMAVRLSPELVGVQFHPEADPDGMYAHFIQPQRKAHVVEHHGLAKYNRILHRLRAPDFIAHTHATVIPNFLQNAVEALRPEPAAVPRP